MASGSFRDAAGPSSSPSWQSPPHPAALGGPPRHASGRIWEMLEENEYMYRLRMLWERLWQDERPEAVERRLSVEGKRATLEEVSDLSKLWLMLVLRLHGRPGTTSGTTGNTSGKRLSWGEFQLAFSSSWPPRVVRRSRLALRPRPGVPAAALPAAGGATIWPLYA